MIIYINININWYKSQTAAAPTKRKNKEPMMKAPPIAVPIPTIHANITLPSFVKIRKQAITTTIPIVIRILTMNHEATTAVI